MYSQGSWVYSGINLSHFGYSQKNLWRAVSISQIRGVWGRNSIHCLSQGRKRMENRGNSAPGQLLIPEQQQQRVRIHGMGIPWNGNPQWPGATAPAALPAPGRIPRALEKNLEELRSCDQAEPEQLLGDIPWNPSLFSTGNGMPWSYCGVGSWRAWNFSWNVINELF